MSHEQYKPLAWQDLDFDELTKAVEDYAKEVMASLKSTGASPDDYQKR
jgi:arabinogalactan endo-1,4-beta-galactosidase